MVSSSKQQKRRTKPNKNNVDRLNTLPDTILIHILSLLPTETAAATTVLSKRWRSLWTLSHDLDLDESRKPHSSQTFETFVIKAMLHRREWFLRRFRLKLTSPCHSSDLDLWVSSAIARSVQELDIDLYSQTLAFPCTQQSCKTLTVLKLSSVSIDGRLDKIFFPVLKTLHLKKVRLERREVSLGGFFSSRRFPVLEELVLHQDSDSDDENFEICLDNLRSLVIKFYPKYVGRGCAIKMDCPALRRIIFYDLRSREFELGNVLSLVEASIDVHINRMDEIYDYPVGENGGAFYARYLMNLIKVISDVRILRLSHDTMREIQRTSKYDFFRWKDVPIFHNLVQAELTFEGSAWESLMFMLQKFQSLECLTLCLSNYQETDKREWMEPTKVPNFMTFHLTTVCFREFEGLGDEMRVARYILDNSLVLKNMKFLFSCSLHY